MALLVTSAAGTNGNGHGALLACDAGGKAARRLQQRRAHRRSTRPRGEPRSGADFPHSGSDRLLALDQHGRVVRDTGPTEGLNPGGGIFCPDGGYYVGLRRLRRVVAFRRFAPGGGSSSRQFVMDPELSPLDLVIATNGNIIVSSEHPFGASDAMITVRRHRGQDRLAVSRCIMPALREVR